MKVGCWSQFRTLANKPVGKKQMGMILLANYLSIII